MNLDTLKAAHDWLDAECPYDGVINVEYGQTTGFYTITMVRDPSAPQPLYYRGNLLNEHVLVRYEP